MLDIMSPHFDRTDTDDVALALGAVGGDIEAPLLDSELYPNPLETEAGDNRQAWLAGVDYAVEGLSVVEETDPEGVPGALRGIVEVIRSGAR